MFFNFFNILILHKTGFSTHIRVFTTQLRLHKTTPRSYKSFNTDFSVICKRRTIKLRKSFKLVRATLYFSTLLAVCTMPVALGVVPPCIAAIVAKVNHYTPKEVSYFLFLIALWFSSISRTHILLLFIMLITI